MAMLDIRAQNSARFDPIDRCKFKGIYQSLSGGIGEKAYAFD